MDGVSNCLDIFYLCTTVRNYLGGNYFSVSDFLRKPTGQEEPSHELPLGRAREQRLKTSIGVTMFHYWDSSGRGWRFSLQRCPRLITNTCCIYLVACETMPLFYEMKRSVELNVKKFLIRKQIQDTVALQYLNAF